MTEKVKVSNADQPASYPERTRQESNLRSNSLFATVTILKELDYNVSDELTDC